MKPAYTFVLQGLTLHGFDADLLQLSAILWGLRSDYYKEQNVTFKTAFEDYFRHSPEASSALKYCYLTRDRQRHFYNTTNWESYFCPLPLRTQELLVGFTNSKRRSIDLETV